MGVFGIEYSAESLPQLKALDKSVAFRIIRKIETTISDPHRLFKRLSGRPEYKLRVGDYRVIADIDDHGQTILIRAVGRRRDIYEKA